uniref:Uncharacterized protein n=1 Tax=Anopheles dirus TaxID=7168 RepID=A0A182NXA0_9DIPT
MTEWPSSHRHRCDGRCNRRNETEVRLQRRSCCVADCGGTSCSRNGNGGSRTAPSHHLPRADNGEAICPLWKRSWKDDESSGERRSADDDTRRRIDDGLLTRTSRPLSRRRPLQAANAVERGHLRPQGGGIMRMHPVKLTCGQHFRCETNIIFVFVFMPVVTPNGRPPVSE